jgi:hypothetical protein
MVAVTRPGSGAVESALAAAVFVVLGITKSECISATLEDASGAA